MVRWVDVSLDALGEPEVAFLRPFVECETLKGVSISLPSLCVRAISDPFEIAAIKSQLPRGVATADYESQMSQELSVHVRLRLHSVLK